MQRVTCYCIKDSNERTNETYEGADDLIKHRKERERERENKENKTYREENVCITSSRAGLRYLPACQQL